MRRTLLPFVLSLACIAATPTIAWADESAAETLFQEGLAAMKRNDYPVACEAFSASNKADPSPGTQINLAVCYEKQKKWASAWTWYRSAVGLAQQRGQKEREQLAEESASRIKPNIHYIVVVVKEPLTDLVVKRDGNEVAIAIAGKEIPLPIDPGEHTLEVSAKGKKTYTHSFKVADNPQTERIEIPTLEDSPVESSAAGGGAALTSREPAGSEGSGQRLAGVIIGGVGVLTGLTSLGVILLAHSEADKRDEQYTLAASYPPGLQYDETNKSARSHHGAAENNQLLSIICASGAAVLIGVGAFLFFTAKSGPAKTGKPHILPQPVLGPTVAGAGLGGTF